MKLRKSGQTIYIRKSDLQTKHTTHFSGPCQVRAFWRPTVIRKPKGWTGDWDNNAGTWVEFKAVRTFEIKEKRKSRK